MAFKCSTQKQAAKLGQRKGGSWGKRQKREAGPKQDTAFETSGGKGGGLAGAVCLGADTLLQMLKNYARSGALKTSITVGAGPSRLCSCLFPSLQLCAMCRAYAH